MFIHRFVQCSVTHTFSYNSTLLFFDVLTDDSSLKTFDIMADFDPDDKNRYEL